MGKKRISMQKIKEILRLKLQLSCSQREIAQSVNAGKTTVQEILWKAHFLKLNWEEVQVLSESQLSEKLFPQIEKKIKERPLPDCFLIQKELCKKHVTLSLLWSEYKEEHPEGLGYSRFCEHYNKWLASNKLSMRQKHKAGEKLFVDFSGIKLPYLDPHDNQIKQAEIFIAVLGASNYSFVYATESQDLASWLNCHVKAFEFFGGVPHVIVPDNLRSGVSKSCRYEPEINPTYQKFAQHYNTVVIPTRAYKPKDKAKVEVGVQIVERWILACLRKETFTSVSEINRMIKPLLEVLNNKTMRQYKLSRKELFDSEEKQELKKLPENRYEFSIWKKVKVGFDYHVAIEQHLYSVPFKYAGKHVDARISGGIIEFFFDGNLIATHIKHPPHRFPTTQAEHMPSSHKFQGSWSTERILKWAKESGLNTVEVCKKIIERAEHPEQAFRACIGIINLGKKFTPERLEAACIRGAILKYPSYKSIKSILQNNLDKLEKKPEINEIKIAHHENIRGPRYYN